MNRLTLLCLGMALIGSNGSFAGDLKSFSGFYWMKSYSGTLHCGSDSFSIKIQGTELVVNETCYKQDETLTQSVVYSCDADSMSCLIDPNISEPGTCLGISLDLVADGHIQLQNPCLGLTAEFYKPGPAITVNSTVTTIAAANMFTGNTVVGHVDANQTFTVAAIQGNWISLKNMDGSAVPGWIQASDLILSN